MLQQLHCLLYLGVRSRTAATVGCFLKAFSADGGNKVLHANHIPAERLVDQCSIGKRKEHAIGVHLAQLDEVLLAHQRFTTRVDIHMRAQLFTLLDDGINLFQA